MLRKLLCLVLLPLLGSAQLSFGENAVWHYDYVEYGFYGYKRVAHTGDTSMFGDTWLRFSVSGVKEIRTGAGPNDLWQDTAAVWPDIFLLTRNDSVFRLRDSVPHLLFDFSANLGESWQFAPQDSGSGCFETPIATVTNKGQTTLGGASLDYMKISLPQDTFPFFGNTRIQASSSEIMDSIIYPELGFLKSVFLFDSDPNFCEDSIFIDFLVSHSLRCFQNDSIQVNLSNNACDKWSFIGLEEQKASKLQLYPNPSLGRLNIESSEEILQVQVLDLTGRIHGTHKASTEIILPAQPGVYILKIDLANGGSQMHRVLRL